jgi:hypothetical protein
MRRTFLCICVRVRVRRRRRELALGKTTALFVDVDVDDDGDVLLCSSAAIIHGYRRRTCAVNSGFQTATSGSLIPSS